MSDSIVYATDFEDFVMFDTKHRFMAGAKIDEMKKLRRFCLLRQENELMDIQEELNDMIEGGFAKEWLSQCHRV